MKIIAGITNTNKTQYWLKQKKGQLYTALQSHCAVDYSFFSFEEALAFFTLITSSSPVPS